LRTALYKSEYYYYYYYYLLLLLLLYGERTRDISVGRCRVDVIEMRRQMMSIYAQGPILSNYQNAEMRVTPTSHGYIMQYN